MRILNRDGEMVEMDLSKIKSRLTRLLSDEEMQILDVDTLLLETVAGITDGISTHELDDLSARICATLQSRHPVYDKLAARIVVSDMVKMLRRRLKLQPGDVPKFSAKVAYIAEHAPKLLDPEYVVFVKANATLLDAIPDYSRDTSHSYFSLRTMQRSYLLRDPVPPRELSIELPQDMWLRVAVALHMPRDRGPQPLDLGERVAAIRRCYDAMSRGLYTHATPTLFNAGMRMQQMSSCYLLGTSDDLRGIYKTLSDCAVISKWAGGIGIHVSNVRAKGALISSTGGPSDGIVPMLKVFNETARYCNQSGRRKGSIAVYLEPWHADVWEFVELRRNVGAETERARDLFLALWVPDEFMKRVDGGDDDWYLMSPDQCPDLVDAVGDEFTKAYNAHVAAGRYIRKCSARALWQHILNCQLETGTPYVCYKDAVNRKSNQANVGVVRSSNLCAEITEVSDDQQYAVCNLASIAVPKFVDREKAGGIDHPALHETARQVVHNLNTVIDINSYPTPEARASNMRLRPIGVGIQGMGDVYCMLGLPYDDARAVSLDAEVMETIYHGALTASVELATRDGPYQAFSGSPASQGKLQFDMWDDPPTTDRYDWDVMRKQVASKGLRHSLLTALMPTASTSQLLGNCESFEPFQSNVYKRSTIAGEFIVVNSHLMQDLLSRGLWTNEVRREVLRSNGSIQNVQGIPDDIKRVYRTVWEVPQRAVIDHAAARGPFVDQSQSMNLYMAPPSSQKLSNALIYGWRKGIKTGMYYLRSAAAVEALQVSVGDTRHGEKGAKEAQACPWRPRRPGAQGGDEEVCEMCSA